MVFMFFISVSFMIITNNQIEHDRNHCSMRYTDMIAVMYYAIPNNVTSLSCRNYQQRIHERRERERDRENEKRQNIMNIHYSIAFL